MVLISLPPPYKKPSLNLFAAVVHVFNLCGGQIISVDLSWFQHLSCRWTLKWELSSLVLVLAMVCLSLIFFFFFGLCLHTWACEIQNICWTLISKVDLKKTGKISQIISPKKRFAYMMSVLNLSDQILFTKMTSAIIFTKNRSRPTILAQCHTDSSFSIWFYYFSVVSDTWCHFEWQLWHLNSLFWWLPLNLILFCPEEW